MVARVINKNNTILAIRQEEKESSYVKVKLSDWLPTILSVTEQVL